MVTAGWLMPSRRAAPVNDPVVMRVSKILSWWRLTCCATDPTLAARRCRRVPAFSAFLTELGISTAALR